MNVLIVDDNATNRKLLRAQLESEGMVVFEAADGVEALAVLNREGSIDAVISDILMPNMDGFRLCLEIRKLPHLSALPFIIYTSTYDSPGDRQLAQTVGADRYLVKPGSMTMILEALRDATRPGATRHGAGKITGDTAFVLKQYNASLVGKLEERTIELTARNDALQKAEQELRLQVTTMETAANAILITDRTGAIQWVNPAFTTLTGYTAEEVIGKTPRVLKSGKHDAAFYRELWKTIVSGQTWRGEFTNRRKDGSLFYDEHTITPVRSKGGEITNFIGILHDVTARKRAEEAIAYRARLAALSAEVSLALTHATALPEMLQRCAAALVTYLDAAFARIWTLNKRDEVLELQASAGMYTHLDGPHGRVPVGKFKIGVIAQERKPHLTNSVVGDPRVGDQEWAKREGMVAFAGYPLLLEGRVVGVMALFARHPLSEATLTALASVADGIALGIDRKYAEENLRETHDQLSHMLEYSPAVIYALKVKGEGVVPYAVSENIKLFLGFEVSEALHYEWWLGQLHPEDRDRAVASASETLEQGTSLTEYRLRHKDGSYRWLEDKRRLIRDSSGQPMEIVGAWADITERRRAEEELGAFTSQDTVRRKKRFFWDSVAVLGLSVVVFVVGYYFDLFGKMFRILANEEEYRFADEAAGALLFLLFAQLILSRRRWKASAGEVTSQKHTTEMLRILHGELDKRVQQRTAELVVTNKALAVEITERRQAEDGLRRSEQRLREMLENLQLIAMTLDKKGAVTFCNDYLLQLTGWKREEVIGADWFTKFIPETDIATQKLFFETIEAGAIPPHRENPIRTRSGELRDIVWNNTVLRDAAGNVTGTASIGEDVTERKRAEEARGESEGKFRQLAENINEVFWITDPLKNQMLYISPAYEKIWGRTCDRLYQSPHDWLEAIHPEDRQRVLQAAVTRQARGDYDEIYRIRRADGEVRWIRDRAFPVRNAAGEVYRVVGTAEDITTRKEAERRLATHHAITQVLTEAATLAEAAGKILPIICRNLQWDVGGLWTMDPAARRLRCVEIWHPPSTEFNELVAFSRANTYAAGEGSPGRVWESGQASWIEDVTRESNLPRRALLTRIGLRSGIAFPIKLRNETFGVIDFFSAQIRPPDDELLAMFATVGSQIGQFIERRRIEEQFRQSQKMDAFGQLAGGVAHDFNNILAVIMGYSSLLLENEGIEAGVKDEMRQVYAAGERAANLTRQLLTFSRKKEMEAHPLDLNGVIANMIKMLGRIIGEHIKLQCNYASNLPAVQADEGMMEQVLMNLAVNARDAMTKGGQLIIETRRVVADAAHVQHNPEGRAGEFVCVSVRDTGCGMTPEIQARIFEPFFTTKDVGKGTGLGLAAVYGIVQQHGGWLEVESQVGVGTVFKVFLPASAPAEAAAGQAVAETRTRGGSETILLVEDELALRALARLVLQRHGYRVLEAGTGAEALAVWEEHGGKVDLLLTDMVMPEGMTGRELAKQLQAQRPALKVIYTSGYSLDAEGTSFRSRQARAFLQKPYNPQKMIKLVRECLDESVA